MSERSLSPAWLASWTERVSGALAALVGEFERRHGFPPGTNEVRAACRDDQTAARTLAHADLISADPATLHDSIGDVTWADVGNGYFLDPASDVLLRQEHGAVDAGADLVVAIGSNGGGLSYFAGSDGSVHRARTALLDGPKLDKVADDLRQFLELLERSLTQFVVDGEPGSL
ncbi:SMI1/KNR4 family protein [Streptomyces sp. NPDC059215]|uniref:SMI1/KNR4 family protein n=1 Tax=Streptomyces sp. NPDC059215 TaxID=3346772 RepID=UPI0036AF4273